jgi:TolB-like protein/class 3 adenylate cyclase
MTGQSRQLAAIMFTDIVGYTALMGDDEKKAFELLKRNRDIQKPLIKHYNGIWIKELGDGVMASFHTVTDAVFCAATIHQACIAVEGLKLRIGIHLGEVIFENNDVFGDGVNIASRLQAMASPGSTWVSEAVNKNLVNKKEITSEFVREETLKNVSEPVKVYEITVKEIPGYLPDNIKAYRKQSMTGKPVIKKTIYVATFVILIGLIATYFFFFNKQTNQTAVNKANVEKSIAIIPFTNMSNDPQQQYFAEGMMDEILNHLYKIGGLNVISRTSSMAYQDTRKTSKEIASELGVANLLEGSVQKDGDHIRIIVQLINGKTDQQLWVGTYDREFKDVFTIQSEIAQQIAAALKVKIDAATKSRIEYVPTENTNAYNLYLQSKKKPLGGDYGNSWKELLEKVIQQDSSFAPAYADLGFYWLLRGIYLGDLDAKHVLDSALPLLRKSIQLDSNLAAGHNYMAQVHLWYEWDFNAAEKEWEKFFELNPSGAVWADNYVDFLNSTGRFEKAFDFTLKNRGIDKNKIDNWTRLAFSYYYLNQPEEAMAILDSAWFRFKDPAVFWNKAWLFIYLGKYQQTIDNLNKYFQSFPDDLYPRVQSWFAIAYFHTGRMNEAEKIVGSLQTLSKKSAVGSPAFHLAMIFAATGRTEMALQWLQKSYTDHEVEMYWLKVEPLFNTLRNDPRFKELLNKIGFK